MTRYLRPHHSVPVLMTIVAFMACGAGCDSRRLAPSVPQEQSASPHNSTAATAADTTEQIVGESDRQPATTATESAQRPDPWRMTDSVLELGIGLGGLLGGVCGTRAVRFLRDARAKSRALKEIVEGNELFKKQQPSQTNAPQQN